MRLSVNDLKAVRTGIGAAVRALHSDVLREAVPDRIAELLWQIDQLRQVGEASSGCDSRQLTPQDPRTSAVAARLFGAPKEPMASVAGRRTELPLETNECDMVKIRQFNADAAAHLDQFRRSTIRLRSGTFNRVAATLEVVAQSQALISCLNAALDAAPTGWPPNGWLWPSY
jgi:hypothetical protein